MPALRPSLRRSVRLRKSCKRMSSTMIPPENTGGNPSPPSVNKANPHSTGSNLNVMAAVSPPQFLPPTSKKSASQSKRGWKSAQNPTDESRVVYWERYPHLTKKLLSWLWDNLADCAVLFNERKDSNTQGSSAKPHGRHKKDINAVIARVIFHQDIVYGAVYNNGPEKFVSVVGSHLAT